MSLFPSRSTGRQRLTSSYWSKRWVGFVLPAIMVGIVLNLLFLANMSYLYGSLFKSNHRVHNLKVLAVDFDGGEIGQALSVAYASLKSHEFPTLEFRSADDYASPELLEEAVCKEDYWGAIYAHSGASDRLEAAINGKNTTAYDPLSTISFAYLASYYPIISASLIQGNMQTLISVASRVYYNLATDQLASVNLSNPTSASAFLNPIQASSTVEMPTNQGTRVMLNTVSMVMPILMQFFFAMAMNGVFDESDVFSKLSKRDTYLVRLGISKLYTLICALCMAGYIWAYREDWSVDGGQFAQTWMCLWLYMSVSYLIVDTMLGSVIPLKFFAFFILTWIIMNVASTIYPFPLSPGFYRIGYMLPAHNIWTLLMEIWSDGCKLHNEVALPVLLAWFVVGHVGSAWSTRKRCLAAERVHVDKGLETDGTASTQTLNINMVDRV